MPDLNHGDLTITTPAFDHGGVIADRFSAEGGGDRPAVSWTGVPDGTVELALMVHDPDAPLTDGFTHWIVTGIDPSTTGFEENEEHSFTTGSNTMGDNAWMGPAPPPDHGAHHYFFHLYALDSALDGGPYDRDGLLDAIDGKIIEQARVMGTFTNDG